jgi:ribosome biogenesis protein MAK21
MAVEKPKRRRGKKDSSIQNITKNEKNSSNDVSHYKAHKTPLINPSEESSSLWYDWGTTLPGRNDSIYNMKVSSNKRQSPELYRKYRSLADEIYRVENSLTGAPGGKAGADERWVENTMKKGTLKDRIAATSVLISTDPIHKLSALDRLLTMAGCLDSGQANSRVAQMAAEALEDLFLNTLLPPGRTLLRLDERPLHLYEPSSGKSLSPRILLLWRFEENLKEKYAAFINDYLAMTLKEGMDLNKIFALRTSGSMLRSIPEGEVQLLSLMVNKLGDPSRKVAAAAGHELRRVLEEHEAMQEVAAREVSTTLHISFEDVKFDALHQCIYSLGAAIGTQTSIISACLIQLHCFLKSTSSA